MAINSCVEHDHLKPVCRRLAVAINTTDTDIIKRVARKDSANDTGASKSIDTGHFNAVKLLPLFNFFLGKNAIFNILLKVRIKDLSDTTWRKTGHCVFIELCQMQKINGLESILKCLWFLMC